MLVHRIMGIMVLKLCKICCSVCCCFLRVFEHLCLAHTSTNKFFEGFENNIFCQVLILNMSTYILTHVNICRNWKKGKTNIQLKKPNLSDWPCHQTSWKYILDLKILKEYWKKRKTQFFMGSQKMCPCLHQNVRFFQICVFFRKDFTHPPKSMPKQSISGISFCQQPLSKEPLAAALASSPCKQPFSKAPWQGSLARHLCRNILAGRKNLQSR